MKKRLIALLLTVIMLLSLMPTMAFAESSIAINSTNFPDANFRKYITDRFDTDKNGSLSSAEISKARLIDLSETRPADLKGVEFFTELEQLYFEGRGIKSIDISKNTKLAGLMCGNNALTELDVSHNPLLRFIKCENNKLTKLDVSNHTALQELDCSNNKLTELNISGCTSLKIFDCTHNYLASLDIRNTPLCLSSDNQVYMGYQNISEVTVVTMTPDQHNAYYKSFAGNGRNTFVYAPTPAVLDSTIFPDEVFRSYISENFDSDGDGCLYSDELFAIKSIDVSGMGISSLSGIQYFTELETLDCSDNQLTKLDIGRNTALTELNCDNNQLSTLNLTNINALTKLNCAGNKLTTLNINSCTALESIDCSANQLTTLGVSNRSTLKALNCSGNLLTTLNVNGCYALNSLNCSDNKLTALDITSTKVSTASDCTALLGNQKDSGEITATMLEKQLTVFADNFADNADNARVAAEKYVASGPISKVILSGLNVPKAGEKLDYSTDITTTPSSAIVTEGAKAPEVCWYVYDGMAEEWEYIDDPDYICKSAKYYGVEVTIFPEDNCYFEFKDGSFKGSVTSTDSNGNYVSAFYSTFDNDDGSITVSIDYACTAVDSRHHIEALYFDKMPDKCGIGGLVKAFKPAVLSGDGTKADYLWYLEKYDYDGNFAGYYVPESKTSLAASLLGMTTQEIKEARSEFGTYFEKGYIYFMYNFSILKDGYVYGSGDANVRTLRVQVSDEFNNTETEFLDTDCKNSVQGFAIALESQAITSLAIPQLSISKTDGKVKLSWDSVFGASKYWIYRSTDGKNFKYYDTTTSTSYTNGSVTSGTKYYYQVKAVNTVNGKDVISKPSSAKSTIPLTTPKLTVSLSAGAAKLSWDSVTGATKYWIYRSTDGKNFKYYDSTTKTTYTNSSVTADGTYYYKVKAVKTVNGTDWTSDYSAAKSVKILKAPDLSIAKADGKIKLSWNAVDGAAKYWIYRSTDGTNYKYYDTTYGTTYTNSSVTSGTKYFYKVKAANADGGASIYSSAKSTVPIKTPVLAGELKDGKVMLSWGAVDGASKYWIYRSTDGENFKYYDSTTKTTYTNSSVTEGTTYYYKIKAAKTIGSTDWASDFSNLISIDR